MRMQRTRFVTPVAAALLVVLAWEAPASAQASPATVAQSQSATAPTSAPAQRADIFDPAADAKAQIAAALDAAGRQNQRVLLLFGGNWCVWCHRLHAIFRGNKDIARMLQYEYQLVLVDAGRFDKNRDVMARYDLELKKTGLPFLVVLGADGQVLARQETGSLEQGQAHDPDKVLAFLAQWKAEPRDAEQAVRQSLAQAAAAQKSVLLRLSAPWCVWCRRLEAFLARPDVEALISRDFVSLSVDVERMTGAKEVAARFRENGKGGMPWLAVLDAEGKVVATSDASGENFGYPAAPGEISAFLDMLRQGAKQLSASDFAKLKDALEGVAAKLKPAAATQP